MNTIGKDTSVTGSIVAEENIRIAGQVRGDVLAAGHEVTLEREARVEGTITARIIVVRGRFSGRLIALDTVRLRESARVVADIAAPHLVLDDGAMFTGAVEPARLDAALRVAAYRRRTEPSNVA